MRPILVDGSYIWGNRKISGLSLVRATEPDLSDAEVVATLPGGVSNNWASIIRVSAGKLAAYVTSLDFDQAGFYAIDDSDPADVSYVRKSAGFPDGYPFPSLQNMAKSADGQYLFACTYGTKDAENPPYYIYRSIDYGETWAQCYTHTVSANTHMHAIEWDSYRSRVWCCVGDYGDGGKPGILYSDDYGANWTLVEAEVGTPSHMLTCIIPVPDGVLFGTDRAPAGILKWTAPGGANVVINANIAQVVYAQSPADVENMGFARRPAFDVSGSPMKILIPFGYGASYAQAWLHGGSGTAWELFNVNKDPDTNNNWIGNLCGITPTTETAPTGWVIGIGNLGTPEYVYRFKFPAWE